MKLYHACQCLDYELRHCFQVSSLLEQVVCLRPVELLLDVATLEGEENALRFPVFEDRAVAKNLTVSLRYYPTPRETFAKRGLTRNVQAKRAYDRSADWVWWADCDHIYPPDFLRRLCFHLHRHPYETKVISASRKLHTDKDAGQALAETARGCPFIEDAYTKVLGTPMRYKAERNVAGGSMQVVSAEVMRSLRWRYVDPRHCLDRHLFRRCQRARSDLTFRHRCGGSTMLDLPLQVHLDHIRDKEDGHKRHIYGVQR
jgi:hypothetical protein